MTKQPTQQIHLFIVTGQTQANLIPILQLKPDLVVLLVSNSMSQQADDFIKILKGTSDYQEPHLLRFDNIPDAGIEKITEKAMEIEAQLQKDYPDCQLTYHATGGTKLMTLGFYSMFSHDDNTVLYCDMAHNEIERVFPEKQSAIPLQPVLNIDSALLSMGQTYRKSSDLHWQEQANARKELTKWLAQNAEQLGDGFFGCLNGMVQKAIERTQRGEVNKIKTPEQKFNFTLGRFWQEALQKLTENKVLQWDKTKPETIYLNTLAGAEYISGQWLEEYIWHIAKDLKPKEVKANVEFAESGALKDDIRNEMDCVVVHNNRLLLIECKTISFNKSEDKNTHIVYKLESLGHRAGGTFGTKWLVSANPVDKATQKRAKEYNIEVLSGKELKQIKQRIKEWMD